ncbi:MAG: Zn-dependent alcohol dehydrogenase [Chloroflexi bacterium]|nr:Zn-dependent alcohol dehydrogenase [Chloroflexota bacterium]
MRAAIFRRPHEPLTIEEVEIADPIGKEVFVRTAASGVCHSDKHNIDDLVGDRWSGAGKVILGHEGSGIVEAVGPDVTYVQPGDHVVACLSWFCGNCEQCLRGRPHLCSGRAGMVTRGTADPPRYSMDGAPVQQGYDIASYAEAMLLHENSVVKIGKRYPLEAASIVGCAVTTGFGAAIRTSGLQPGETAAVFGCGGVGLSVIQGARVAGARRIIAVDKFEAKLELACELGATDAVNATETDPVAAIRELTGGRGVDHAFEAVGLPMLVTQAVQSLAIRGTATVVGVLPAGAKIEFPWEALRPECRLQTSRMGSNAFRVDIPNHLELYEQGRLRLDEMISRRIPLDSINDAFRAMDEGDGARSLLVFD